MDLSAPGLLGPARARHALVVGLLAPGAATCDGPDAFVRDAADLPQLLKTLLRDRDDGVRHAEELAALTDVISALAAGGDVNKLLARVVARLQGRLDVSRCSVILLEAEGTGLMVASSEDPSAGDKRIDLAHYPEIREVLLTGSPLVIDDALRHPLLDPVRARLEAHEAGAIAVVPMASEGLVVGVVFVRSAQRGGFQKRDMSFFSSVASAAAVALRNAGRVQLERRQRAAAEREVLQLRRYEEIFSHVSDGMAVLDEAGHVLSLNPAGCATLGVPAEQARGVSLQELVAPESAAEAHLLWRELSRGGRVLSADLKLLTRDGRRVALSISAGPLRSQTGRAILSFRDVTDRRELEAELRKTKEFLERLIDAARDGIVAADLGGGILLFNKAAERMIGFTAADLVGKGSVADLYPPGQAKAIMARLRAAREAGQDLPPLRCEVIARSGEVIPVELSVALVAEGGQETATVGLFRDLREELRVESELQRTRERLQIAEKAALVSELAGAAAHELNQPLTSVLGFGELLFRRTQEHERGRDELAAILREAERMADIVKKIGKITRYETTPYVGNTRIVDLDRASDPPPLIIRDKP